MESWSSVDRLQRLDALSNVTIGSGVSSDLLKSLECATPVFVEACIRFSAWLEDQQKSRSPMASFGHTLAKSHSAKNISAVSVAEKLKNPERDDVAEVLSRSASTASARYSEKQSTEESRKLDDPWVNARWIARRYSVSYRTGRRWIMQLLGDHDAMLDKRRKGGKRPYRMRGSPSQSLKNTLTSY